MQRELKTYIDDIITAVEKIEKYTAEMLKEDLEINELVQDAVVRNLEIIGEAVKKIPDEVRNKQEDIPWKKIAGLRDILVHEYFGVNMNIVWDVIENKLKPLKAAAIELQDEYN